MVAVGQTGNAIFRFGGLKFNGPLDSDGQYTPDYLQSSELTDLGAITSAGIFINNWVNDNYSPGGGDKPELQLDALDSAAADMNAHSTPGNSNRYIVLVTDDVFHFLNDQTVCYTGPQESFGGSSKQVLGSTGVIADLQNSGCKVYISLYDVGGNPRVEEYNSQYTTLQQVYTGLDVSGNFDTVKVNDSDLSTMYTFDKLKAQITANWPAN